MICFSAFWRTQLRRFRVFKGPLVKKSEMQTEKTSSGIHCDRQLAQRLERAEADCNVEFVMARGKAFPEIGCDWTEIAGASAMFDGVGSPCTQTFGLGIFEDVTPEHLNELEHFFRKRGAEVCHEVCSLADISLIALLNERGYRPVEMSSVLFQTIGSCPQIKTGNTQIDVREIESDEHQLWAQIAADGWSDVVEGLEEYLLNLARVNPYRKKTRFVIAEKQAQPIATAAICLAHGVAVLAGACTLPHYRRQGAQLALLKKRLQLAVENGCDLAMMAAQPGSNSQRNAERQQFRVAYTRTKWRLFD